MLWTSTVLFVLKPRLNIWINNGFSHLYILYEYIELNKPKKKTSPSRGTNWESTDGTKEFWGTKCESTDGTKEFCMYFFLKNSCFF